ncbi:ABC transporter ATP-binding protein [Kitasatospora phosalacinea]|uniref:ABC transporter ATP-binding protein n=1 Tax=Kitasatospora phosalacinea TaxID=2065 RepID=A0A9W6UPP0_9ACTN|nr:ABC transporter ATP-binding protein [Kitasatospora phosalacinea]GLW55362.1 ABC transporter ATP-binding protein [Kitasatospora phosalacinea]
MTPVLQARALRVNYGPAVAVAGVDLSIGSGEVVGVVGASGSGKTTLLHCLSGLLAADSGSVLFRDRPIEDMTERQRDELRRSHFGFVFQFGDLVPELTLVENVSLPLRLQGVRAARARERAAEQLDALGIGHLGPRTVGEVSGGELQRAAIARAVVHRPDVVFADEPTGALDDRNSEAVFELLLQQARTHGAAVVLVTHDRHLAARTDRTVVLVGGRVVGAGAGAEVEAG